MYYCITTPLKHTGPNWSSFQNGGPNNLYLHLIGWVGGWSYIKFTLSVFLRTEVIPIGKVTSAHTTSPLV